MTAELKLWREIFTLEIRKILAYRSDFWLNFVGIVFIELSIAYFLWRAVFDYQEVDTLRGFSFEAIVLYYLFVPLITHVVQAQVMHFVSNEIYDGTLNRYIIYPLDFFKYKLIAHLAFATLGLAQFFLALGIYLYFFEIPPDVNLTITSVTAGLMVALICSVLYFFIATAIEMSAFWFEHIWSLMVTLKFCGRLLGASVIPLAFFPEWAREVLPLLPFYLYMAYPIEIIMGKQSLASLSTHIPLIFFWLAFAFISCRIVWRRGSYQYTGVGI